MTAPLPSPPATEILLGGRTPAEFLREYWQKRPLLVRGAYPDFTGFLDRAQLCALSTREDVESRLVRGAGLDYTLERGPIRRSTLRKLPGRDWTLLVQGVNLHDRRGEALLGAFDFVSRARLDDLMVSYAAPGGGVGPHFDSYDVFLLQGFGRRRWQVSAQRDLDLLPDAPLKLLADFRPEQEWLLEPGDLLYLPPQFAHWGVAEDACTTYSIGFRAPGARELAHEFFNYLQDRLDADELCADELYADPDLAPQAHAAEIHAVMRARVYAMLDRARWGRREVDDFLGRYLTEPKAQVYFDPPEDPLPFADFVRYARTKGVRLDLRTQMLFTGGNFYVNGEHHRAATAARAALTELADRRSLGGTAVSGGAVLEVLYGWYLDGYLELSGV